MGYIDVEGFSVEAFVGELFGILRVEVEQIHSNAGMTGNEGGEEDHLNSLIFEISDKFKEGRREMNSCIESSIEGLETIISSTLVYLNTSSITRDIGLRLLALYEEALDELTVYKEEMNHIWGQPIRQLHIWKVDCSASIRNSTFLPRMDDSYEDLRLELRRIIDADKRNKEILQSISKDLQSVGRKINQMRMPPVKCQPSTRRHKRLPLEKVTQ